MGPKKKAAGGPVEVSPAKPSPKKKVWNLLSLAHQYSFFITVGRSGKGCR
jgi:hypothetical protein